MPSGSNRRARRNGFERLPTGPLEHDPEHLRRPCCSANRARAGAAAAAWRSGRSTRPTRRAAVARAGPSVRETELDLGVLNRIGAGRRHDVAEAQAEGQQVLDGDGPLGRHRVVERRLEAAQDAPVGQLGQERLDRVVQRQGCRRPPAIMAAAAAIGLVSDAMRKMASRRSGARHRAPLAEHLDVHVVAARQRARRAPARRRRRRARRAGRAGGPARRGRARAGVTRERWPGRGHTGHRRDASGRVRPWRPFATSSASPPRCPR